MKRREFAKSTMIVGGALLLAPSLLAENFANDKSWQGGDMLHIIPAASHNRFLIKLSLRSPRKNAPELSVNKTKVRGLQTDIEGRYWQFDVQKLSPSTEYKLQLLESTGKEITDYWALRTFPAPNDEVKSLRILSYTCGGGMSGPLIAGKTGWLDMEARKQLFAFGMSFNPDVCVANGDQIYWDIQSVINLPKAMYNDFYEGYWKPAGGKINTDLPMTDPVNYPIFKYVTENQIPALYGNSLRSTPSFFLTDDHDAFENDEFNDKIASLPVDSYGIFGEELTQKMFYPEFLPSDTQPDYLEGTGKAGRAPGTNMFFGTFRYGKLFEMNLFDCRRYVDYKGVNAKVIPQWVEKWLIDRIKAEDTHQHILAPSLPFAYSSGKLGDWYPDALDEEIGKLVMYKSKQGWQTGWFGQHQRLLKAMSEQKTRTPIIVQGDFHASSAGKITRSGELQLKNPVHAVLSGTLGTGDLPFPSCFRAVESSPSQLITMEETLKPLEKNGFSIIDITPEKVIFKMFAWRPPQPVSEIAAMKPVLEYVIPRT